jgi:hypothetical protein
MVMTHLRCRARWSERQGKATRGDASGITLLHSYRVRLRLCCTTRNNFCVVARKYRRVVSFLYGDGKVKYRWVQNSLWSQPVATAFASLKLAYSDCNVSTGGSMVCGGCREKKKVLGLHGETLPAMAMNTADGRVLTYDEADFSELALESFVRRYLGALVF